MMPWILDVRDAAGSADAGGKARALARAERAGLPVPSSFVLSASASKPSNYPVAAVQTLFSAAGQGTLAACPTATNCNTMLTYASYARLMALQTFEGYGGTPGVATTWEIIADGGLTASPKATVEIQAMIETPKVPASTYGAFGTDTMCGAKHSMMKNQPDGQCIKMCVRGPNEYALFDGSAIWKLSDQKRAAKFAAQRVTVTGTLDKKARVIKVVSVEGASQ